MTAYDGGRLLQLPVSRPPDGSGMTRIILAFMLILALAGFVVQAGEHEPTAYDLNGRWKVTDVLCHDRSGRNEMIEQGFHTRGYGGELQTIKQAGTDLEIVFLNLLYWDSDGELMNATLSGNRFRYEGYSDEVGTDGRLSRSFKGKGRVLSCDRIVERLTYWGTDLSGGNGGYFHTCELEVERVFVGSGLLELDEDEAQAVGEPRRGAVHPCTRATEKADVVDRHVCTDEREQAVEYAGQTFAVPAVWDGTPFIVDVSSSFPNAQALLNVVADEAARIYTALGYHVFVAGEVRRPVQDLVNVEILFFKPRDQRIEIHCCYGEGSGSAGTAYPGWRLVLLDNNAFQSLHIMVHELYHMLGFKHPGESAGVEMSDLLMYGPGSDQPGASMPTRPSALDLEKLACIYDR